MRGFPPSCKALCLGVSGEVGVSGESVSHISKPLMGLKSHFKALDETFSVAQCVQVIQLIFGFLSAETDSYVATYLVSLW